jgi:RNA polymerase sigma factor (sigma-70 family)
MSVEQAIATLRNNATDVKAWEILHRHLRPQLLSYALVLLDSFRVPLDLAEDVTQDALLAFLRHWRENRDLVDSADAATGYLKKSVRNLLVDRFRHENRHPQLVDFLSLRFDSAFGNEASIHRNIYVSDILGRLSGNCAKLLKRYVEEDLSLAELADEEHVSPKTFYSRWYRCLEKAYRAVSEVSDPNKG